MTRRVLAATFIAATLGLFSCTPKADRADRPPAPINASLGPLLGDWELRRIQGSGLKIPRPITMKVTADGGVSGFAGVNHYSSSLDLSRIPAGGFKLSPIAMTRMAGPDELMSIENAFTAAIEKESSFEVNGDELVIMTQDPMFLLFNRPTRK